MFFQRVLKLKVIVILILLMSSWTAQSSSCSVEDDEFSELCFSVGFGLGLSQLSGFDDANASWKLDNISSNSIELYAGYHFIPRWFAEISYTQFGVMDLVNPYGGVQEFADVSFSGFSLKGGYYLPVSWLTFGHIESSDFQPFVKMGMASISSIVSDARVKLDEGASIKPQLAFGVDWRFSEDWQARAQWEATSELANVTQLAVSYLFSVDPSSEKKPVYQAEAVDESEYSPLTSVQRKTKRHKNKATFDTLYFKVASTQIDAKSNAVLEKTKRILAQYPHLHVSIMDAELSRNSNTSHKALSQQRAKLLRQLLIGYGISAKRIDRNYYAQSVGNHYQAADFFGRKIKVKTLVLSPVANEKWALFNR